MVNVSLALLLAKYMPIANPALSTPDSAETLRRGEYKMLDIGY